MRRRREDLTPRVREKVVGDYLAGEKTIVIQHEYKISPGEMYRTLHRANVKLRAGTAPSVIFLDKGIALTWGTLHSMLKEFVPKAEKLTWDESLSLVYKVLEEKLKREPNNTINELGYDKKSFTIKEMMIDTISIYVEAIFESYPDKFVKIDDDHWKVKENASV